MKKFSKIYPLIATALMLSALPAHGMQEGAQHMYQTGKEYAGATRDYLMNEFNESVDRLKRCVTFQSCSKMDVLKMGRDLLILLGAVYSAKEARKSVLRRWGKRTPPPTPRQALPTLPPFKKDDTVAYKWDPETSFKVLWANEETVLFPDGIFSQEKAHEMFNLVPDPEQ